MRFFFEVNNKGGKSGQDISHKPHGDVVAVHLSHCLIVFVLGAREPSRSRDLWPVLERSMRRHCPGAPSCCAPRFVRNFYCFARSPCLVSRFNLETTTVPLFSSLTVYNSSYLLGLLFPF